MVRPESKAYSGYTACMNSLALRAGVAKMATIKAMNSS